MKLPLFIHITVIILSPWWWIIIERNLWVSLLVFILSVAVFIYFWQVKSKKLFFLLLLLSTILFFVAVKDAFDESIFRNSALDIQQLNKRHEFYASGLGKLYKNRFVLTYFKDYNFPISKLKRNFFANFDPNLYFFASHPRERLGVEEFEKYPLIFLPFFLIGVLYSIYILSPNLFIYSISILLISSIISSKYNLGPVLFFPLISYMITIGFILTGRYLIGRLRRRYES